MSPFLTWFVVVGASAGLIALGLGLARAAGMRNPEQPVTVEMVERAMVAEGMDVVEARRVAVATVRGWDR